MERDEDGVYAARIQYQLDSSQKMPICPESHICFAVLNHDSPRPQSIKRAKIDDPEIPYTTANAIECDRRRVQVVGVSVSGSLDIDAIKRHPVAAGRVTVQCAGVVNITTPVLHRSIRVGSYICVDPESEIQESYGLPKDFGTFEIKEVKFMTNRKHVIGRVCAIRLLSHNYYVLSVVLALQPPAPKILAPLSSILTEESVFQMYMSPDLLNALWTNVTPINVAGEANDRSKEMAQKLKTLREDALKSNQALAGMIERAINEVEFTEVPEINFPKFHEMSMMGTYAFLIGSKETRGVLWYATSIKDAQIIISQILLLMPENGAHADYIVSQVFKTDGEYALFERFDMWSKRHHQHSFEPRLSSLRSCLMEIQSN